MSLKDTIRGAREEAAASVNPFERKSKQEEETDEAVKPSVRTRSRRSAANLKPSREAAAGVRVVSSDGTTTKSAKDRANMTKEERKEEKRKKREKEDRRFTASQMVLEENEEYTHARKIWRRLLLVGAVFMGAALVMYVSVTNLGDSAPSWMAIGSIVLMVVSYLILIGGLIYDYRIIKPMRTAAEQRVASMSERKVKALTRNK